MFIGGIINSGYQDLQKPVAGTLTYSNLVRGAVDLSCTATDNKGVKEFKVYIDSVYSETVVGTVLDNHTVVGIPGGSNIDIFVTAVDINDNESLASNILNIDTIVDAVPVIGTLTYANEDNTTVELSCTATDDFGVVSFNIYVDDILDRNVVGSSLSSYILNGLTKLTTYSIKVEAIDDAGQKSGFSNSVSFTTTNVTGGQEEFTTPGTYQWTAPAGVTLVSVVAIGGGGGGAWYSYGTYHETGGSGGGLGWKNNIAVTPGQSYTVVAGSGGGPGTSDLGEDGEDSYFINSTTVKGGKGVGGRYNQARVGGDYVGDGGGNGGSIINQGNTASGGGGAGGYSGDGGNGGNLTGASWTVGSGGGGAGGSGSSDGKYGFGGGGVGIYGEGASGTAAGQGGSGGEDGISSQLPYTAGVYGAGGGGTNGVSNGSHAGASGAVRIIWGTGRAFPSTNTTDV